MLSNATKGQEMHFGNRGNSNLAAFRFSVNRRYRAAIGSISPRYREILISGCFRLGEEGLEIRPLVVGLEIRREIHTGEFGEVRRAALPLAAALGGMVAPALIFFPFNLLSTQIGRASDRDNHESMPPAPSVHREALEEYRQSGRCPAFVHISQRPQAC